MTNEEWFQEDGWILTYTGRQFRIHEPHPDDICIEDIAHALCNVARWTGHTKRHYSVAEHSVYVHDHVSEENRLWALLHDATEAYIGDLSRPLKFHLPKYRELEREIHLAIARHFGLPVQVPDEVLEVDCRILANECGVLIENGDMAMGPTHIGPLDMKYPIPTEFQRPEMIHTEFMHRFNKLKNERS